MHYNAAWEERQKSTCCGALSSWRQGIHVRDFSSEIFVAGTLLPKSKSPTSRLQLVSRPEHPTHLRSQGIDSSLGRGHGASMRTVSTCYLATITVSTCDLVTQLLVELKSGCIEVVHLQRDHTASSITCSLRPHSCVTESVRARLKQGTKTGRRGEGT